MHLRTPIAAWFVSLFLLFVAHAASAQPANVTSPVAKGEKVVYIFTGGGIDDTPTDDTAVVVSCMNISKNLVNARVEFFGDPDGTFLGSTVLALGPGDTDHAGTDNVLVLAVQVAPLTVDITIGVGGRVVLLDKGALLCTAHLYINHTSSTPKIANLGILAVPKPPKFKPSRN